MSSKHSKKLVDTVTYTVFENRRISLIQHCERSELRLDIAWTKSSLKSAENDQFWRVFQKSEAFGKRVLPDKSVLICQKLVEIAKIKIFKCDILSNFQTMWSNFYFKNLHFDKQDVVL